jgi:tetratricopeptide (TPR) repeat protein
LQQVLIASGNNRYKIGAIPGAIEDYQQLMKEAQKNIEPPEHAEVWFAGIPPEVRKRLSLQAQQNVEIAKSAISKTLAWQGKIDDAVAQFESGIEKNRQLLASLPESSTPLDRRNATDQVAMQLSNLGRLLLRFERAEPAMKALSESVQLRAGNYQSDATDAYNKKEYAACLHYAGVAHDLLNQPKEALVHFERARGLREEIAQLSGSVSSKVDLMLTQARLGNESETLKWIDQLSQNTGKNHDLWLDIARSYSQLVRRGADNKRDRYRQAAIEALRRVVQDGLLHPFPLEREPDLAPIRSEPAYLEIVKQLTDKSQGP